MELNQKPTKHKRSKFIFDSIKMQLICGKLPTKDGQLWNGESHLGEKMQFAGNSGGHPTPYWDRPTPYWGR